MWNSGDIVRRACPGGTQTIKAIVGALVLLVAFGWVAVAAGTAGRCVLPCEASDGGRWSANHFAGNEKAECQLYLWGYNWSDPQNLPCGCLSWFGREEWGNVHC